MARGDSAAAERCFTDALDLIDDKASASPEGAVVAASAHLGRGRTLLGRDDLDGAAADFDQTCRLQPGWPAGFYWSGCTAAHAGRFDQAAWFFDATIARDPVTDAAYLQRGYVHARSGRRAAALTDIFDAHRRRPVDSRTRLLAACLLLAEKDWRTAQLWAASVSPRQPLSFAVEGVALYRLGRTDAAQAALERALAGGRSDVMVLLHHGKVCYDLGRYSASVVSWTAVRDRHPEHMPVAALLGRACYARARERLARGDHRGAAEDLAVAAAGSSTGALRQALTELNVHLAAEAMAAGDRATARRRLAYETDPRALYHLAVGCHLDGRPARAERIWECILAERPADPRARLALALCALERGEQVDDVVQELSDDAGPGPVGALARRAAAALLVRRRDWAAAADALDRLDTGDVLRTALLAECRYRAGRQIPPSLPADHGWAVLARLRSGALAVTDPVAEEVATADRRLGREVALQRRGAALDAASEGDWNRAADLLCRSEAARRPDDPTGLLDAVVCCLGGQRPQAVARLSALDRSVPEEPALCHALAVMTLNTLSGPVPSPPPAVSWETCIGAWTAVLHDTDYWGRVLRRAQERYGYPLDDGHAVTLRTALRAHVEERLAAGGAEATLTLVRREWDAASRLHRLGGLSLPDRGGARLACGPLRIAELGRQRELSLFLLALTQAGADVADAARSFCQVGLAEVHLSAGRPDRAVRAALDLRCPDCRRDGVRGGPDEPRVCRADCPDFDRYNPALTAVHDKHTVLSRMGERLAVEGLLENATTMIAANPPDPVTAGTLWASALALGARYGDQDRLVRRIGDAALGRVQTLSGRKRWTEAIDLLDAALDVVHPGEERGRLEGRLSSLLAARGVATFNADRATVAAARADLRRAVELAPHVLHPRLNLARVLREMAFDRLDDRDLLGAAELLQEAVGQFDAGLADRPRQPELREGRDTAQRDLDTVLGAVLRLYKGGLR